MIASRAPTVDALRGLALFGILAVNIQSVVWGTDGPSLGPLDGSASAADTLTVFLSALLLEFKFYPIFCFCFGYGFAVQTQSWTSRGINANERFGRRLTFMMILGALHGTFIWFGDILTRYGITGWILRRHIGNGPRKILKAAKFWAAASVAIALFGAFAFGSTGTSQSDAEQALYADTAQAAMDATVDIYVHGDYWSITAQRVKHYAIITAGLVMYLPQLMLLFLLGALTAHMGWLRQPARHRLFWRRILIIGLGIGIPLNFLYANQALESARHWTSDPGLLEILIPEFVPILASGYVAMLALLADTHIGQCIIALLAPLGRMALSNYLLQSLVMSMLLYGYGLGLGDTLDQAELFSVAIAIYAAQMVFSHWYLRHWKQGPMEIIWRRYTEN